MTASLVLALLLVYLVERLRPLALQWINRGTAVIEGAELPSDLKMMVNSESEGWSREDSEKRFRELYADLGSWDKVRAYLHRTH